ncbi:Hypothetical predicted protein [Mytilus galloprovincialis]|uniref:Uncharacterized protein n=1 Tax=Mytilus galloprovincialis TaxID=29158 RepID=A0A8B6CPZ7_MYTGA|nr:Hypothetical predicted protein [Mytilus galloprovincialis]
MGQYSNCNKDVKKATRKDKKDFIEGLALEAKKAASKQRMGDLYQITKKLCGQKRNTNMPLKDKQGNLITSEKEQENRWNEHFKEVLNRPEPETTANIPIAEHDLEKYPQVKPLISNSDKLQDRATSFRLFVDRYKHPSFSSKQWFRKDLRLA